VDALIAAARGAPMCAGVEFERSPLARFWRRADFGAGDLVLVASDRVPSATSLARWRRLARSVVLVIVTPRRRIDDWEAIGAARGVGLVAMEDLSGATLETAIRAVSRARQSEQALLSLLAARNRVLSDLRFAAADLSLAERELTTRLARAPNGVVNALAQEAIAALEEAAARMAAAFADADADRPLDLVALVDALVQPDGRVLDPDIRALTSEGPMWLATPARETRALLAELLARWRLARGIGDRLELIVWDGGESARIAAVFSRADSDAPRMSLASVALDLIARLQPAARACRARIEPVGESRGRAEHASLAIHLPKRGMGPRPARPRNPMAGDDLVGQAGDPASDRREGGDR
jgi:hypothetical protein